MSVKQRFVTNFLVKSLLNIFTTLLVVVFPRSGKCSSQEQGKAIKPSIKINKNKKMKKDKDLKSIIVLTIIGAIALAWLKIEPYVLEAHARSIKMEKHQIELDEVFRELGSKYMVKEAKASQVPVSKGIEDIETEKKYEIHENIYREAKKNNIDIDWIIKECEKEKINPEVILNTIYQESRFDPKATNSIGNSAGTDNGFVQINDYYKPYIKEECVWDWRCSTKVLIDHAKDGKIKHWYGSRKVLSQGFKVFL